ncbi:hypothetical protein FB451DRAFT_1167753 [Mycena latifolia]|nr:hypothetical protein FB451DRAFT_1167753 [Mycena latifolia]
MVGICRGKAAIDGRTQPPGTPFSSGRSLERHLLVPFLPFTWFSDKIRSGSSNSQIGPQTCHEVIAATIRISPGVDSIASTPQLVIFVNTVQIIDLPRCLAFNMEAQNYDTADRCHEGFLKATPPHTIVVPSTKEKISALQDEKAKTEEAVNVGDDLFTWEL